jgi:hypothetical protein
MACLLFHSIIITITDTKATEEINTIVKGILNGLGGIGKSRLNESAMVSFNKNTSAFRLPSIS